MQLQDTLYVQLGPVTEYEDQIFGIQPNTVRPYEYKEDTAHIAVTYEFDLNLYRIDREAYNVLDWLGDLGGLKEAVTIVFGLFIGIFHYHTFEDYLTSKMYRSETSKDRYSSANTPDNETPDTPDALYLKKHEGKQLDPDRMNCFR